MPGDRLGHFDLEEYIGGGGMGRVFRGLDTRLARQVAVKILAPEHADDEETRLRFQNEAQSAARLDHENIARVYYVGEDRGMHYIVFEYIAGINVRALVELQQVIADAAEVVPVRVRGRPVPRADSVRRGRPDDAPIAHRN